MTLPTFEDWKNTRISPGHKTKRKQLKISNENEKKNRGKKTKMYVQKQHQLEQERKKKKNHLNFQKEKARGCFYSHLQFTKKIPHLLQFPSVSRHKKNKLKNIRSPPTNNRDVILTPFATSKVFQPTLKYSTHALIKKRFLFIRQHATQQQAQQYCV